VAAEDPGRLVERLDLENPTTHRTWAA
jgi:hypothetical protein